MNVNSVELSSLAKLYLNRQQQTQQSKVEVCTSPFEKLTPEQKLNSIMPSQEMEKYYDSICKSLNLDVKPRLNLVSTYKTGWGGGFLFMRNEINLSIEDLVCSDYKIIGIKDNKHIPIFDPKTELPLFTTKNSAESFIKAGINQNNYGFDSLYIKPTTLEDKKRVILQKLSHELIHAQQHAILRQTEGIGEKEIMKAWTHIIPKTEDEKQKLNEYIEKEFKISYWGNKTATQVKIPRLSPQGFIALAWLNAIRNYPTDINSPSYRTNAIEVDAYKRSAQYVRMLFGPIKV